MRTLTSWHFGIVLVIIAISALASDDTSARLESIAKGMYCNCGCGEMLSECAHVKCKRKAALKREIADGIAKGETDGTILDQMSTKYGAMILAAPPFRGFNIALWIFPLAIAIIAVAVMMLLWKKSRTIPSRQG